MNDSSLLFAALATLSGAAAVIFSYVSFLRARKQDGLRDGHNAGAVMTELGYIKSGIDDIKHREDKLEARYSVLLERLAAVETALRLK